MGGFGLLGRARFSNAAQKHVSKTQCDSLCQEPGAAGPVRQGPFNTERRGQRRGLHRASKGVTSDPPPDRPTSVYAESLVAPGRPMHRVETASPPHPGTCMSHPQPCTACAQGPMHLAAQHRTGVLRNTENAPACCHPAPTSQLDAKEAAQGPDSTRPLQPPLPLSRSLPDRRPGLSCGHRPRASAESVKR